MTQGNIGCKSIPTIRYDANLRKRGRVLTPFCGLSTSIIFSDLRDRKERRIVDEKDMVINCDEIEEILRKIKRITYAIESMSSQELTHGFRQLDNELSTELLKSMASSLP